MGALDKWAQLRRKKMTPPATPAISIINYDDGTTVVEERGGQCRKRVVWSENICHQRIKEAREQKQGFQEVRTKVLEWHLKETAKGEFESIWAGKCAAVFFELWEVSAIVVIFEEHLANGEEPPAEMVAEYWDKLPEELQVQLTPPAVEDFGSDLEDFGSDLEEFGT